MKFFTILLTLMSMTFFANVSLDDFEQSVDNAYYAYKYKLVEHNEYFSMVIVEGVHNDALTYGVYFYNQTSGALNLTIMQGEMYYELNQDKRNDVAVVAFNPKETTTLSFIVSDQLDRTYYQFEVILRDKLLILTQADLHYGLDDATQVTKLSRVASTEFTIAIVIGLGAIVVLCLTVITLWWAGKKGMFKKETRAQDLFLFGQHYTQLPPREEDALVDQYFEKMDLDDQTISKPIEVYQKPYSRYEEEIRENDFNVAKFLEDKGFSTDYRLLEEEEKNGIMLELMKLRKTKEITIEQYQEEVIKLWMKSN